MKNVISQNAVICLKSISDKPDRAGRCSGKTGVGNIDPFRSWITFFIPLQEIFSSATLI